MPILERWMTQVWDTSQVAINIPYVNVTLSAGAGVKHKKLFGVIRITILTL